GDVPDPELALQEHAVAGLEVVGGTGAVHDAVQVRRLHARLGERLEGRPPRQRGTGLAVRHPVSRLDPRSLGDPLVGGVHDLCEVVVGHDALGNVEPGGDELGAWHRFLARKGRRKKISPATRHWQGSTWFSRSAARSTTPSAGRGTCPTSSKRSWTALRDRAGAGAATRVAPSC